MYEISHWNFGMNIARCIWNLICTTSFLKDITTDSDLVVSKMDCFLPFFFINAELGSFSVMSNLTAGRF